jgi:hypothetical protein
MAFDKSLGAYPGQPEGRAECAERDERDKCDRCDDKCDKDIKDTKNSVYSVRTSCATAEFLCICMMLLSTCINDISSLTGLMSFFFSEKGGVNMCQSPSY